ncbi:M23 family metallopeptidase [Pseudomarimonas arenosa]|uniref:M23 family metallopeptidase n=1 Tax=Pseudomarimonas arenosa TaxID=2774145 RepID=A0AAW3ZE92_9GAMM|nr:M23 family metallopeptidase [Pseudomarimonas arenosa]MBD8524565.1 M23 family metallopeptidase [Pseudomarimonas arenosa]
MRASSRWVLAGLAALSASQAQATELPRTVQQGSLVRLCCYLGASASLQGKPLAVSANGHIVFGVGRDEVGPLTLVVSIPGQATLRQSVLVEARAWPTERVDGVPPKTVNPPPEIAQRIAEEQARVTRARQRNDAREDFIATFRWPVRGRVSGHFGSQRIYNGQAGSAHSGLDIAAGSGTPIHAPAAGVVGFADPDLYLTGGTVLLDHGQGVSSVFLHLSKIEVKTGQRIEQGQVIGAVGATGRASGPHLHWGLNWFTTRLDPASVLPSD